jgi:hypothetical protein
MDTVPMPIVWSMLGIVAAVLLGRLILRGVRESQAANAAMAALGFRPCPEETASLEATVRALHSASNIEVRRAEKLETRAGPVYRYEVHSLHDDTPSASEEFLLPMRRKSDRPMVLFMPPEGLGEGLARTMLEKLTAVLSPAGLAPVDVPRPLRSSVLSALGPRGSDLYDLIDDRQLTQLRQAARLGFYVARATGQHCALEVLSDYGRRMLPSFDLASAARYVRELAERPASI